jgi:hypothetical protein
MQKLQEQISAHAAPLRAVSDENANARRGKTGENQNHACGVFFASRHRG